MFERRTISSMIIIISLGLCLAGCNNSDSNINDAEKINQASNTISGTWEGSISGLGHTINATMSLQQNGGNINGTYVLEHEGDTDSGTVSGTYANGSGTFSFVSDKGSNADGSFQFDGDNAAGTFSYGGFSLTITLTRQ